MSEENESKQPLEAASELKGMVRPLWMAEVEAEMERARKKFPCPNLLVTAFSEEAGEVVKAVLEHYEGKGSLADVRKELIQTAAMVGRLLEEGDPIHLLNPPIHAA